MTLEKMIDEASERLEYYDTNPNAPNAAIYIYATASRLEALLTLQHEEQQKTFYNEH